MYREEFDEDLFPQLSFHKILKDFFSHRKEKKSNVNLVNIKIQKPIVKSTLPKKVKFKLVIEFDITIIYIEAL